MPKFTLYILFSQKFKRTYVGQTENVRRRLDEHNKGKVRSTKAFIPWEILYQEECKSREEALDREKYYKSYTGRQILKNMLDK